MKLITFNIWGGRVNDPLPEFFAKYNDVDIFCFQEVFQLSNGQPDSETIVKVEEYELNADLFGTLKRYLPSHNGYFCKTFQETYGMSIFLKDNIKIIDKGEVLVSKGDWDEGKEWKDSDHDRKIQWLKLEVKGKEFFIINTHLTHRPNGKLDSPKRIRQSEIISEFLDKIPSQKLLAGDFNLLPDTQSIKIVEDTGMRNLIKDYKVTSTRTKLYRKFIEGPKFADYIFISPDIQVNDFKVLPDIVSDHSPLIIDFDL